MRRFALLVSWLALLAGVAATVSGGATQAEPRWVITDLGTLGGEESYAAAINAEGVVVGWSKTTKGVTHPFSWMGGRMTDLGGFGGHSAWATDVNDRGIVIGNYNEWWNDEYEGYASASLGFVGKQGSWTGLTPEFSDLVNTPDDAGTEVRAINERGQMAGSAQGEYYEPRAHVWETPDFSAPDWNELYHNEGAYLSPRRLGAAYDINEAGQVVGERSGAPSAVLWEDGRARDLGTLGGRASSARAINDAGQIVGRSQVGDGAWHAFMWQEASARLAEPERLALLIGIAAMAAVAILLGASWLLLRFISQSWYVLAIVLMGLVPALLALAGLGVMRWHASPSPLRDLGTLPGQPYSFATALNERGQVIGWSSLSPRYDEERPPTPHAFLWEDGEMLDLGTLGGRYSIAFAIGEKGQVVGQSRTAKGQWHAFIWEAGEMTALPTLGGTYSAAMDVNDAGQIVGWSRTPKDVKHAVLWTLKR